MHESTSGCLCCRERASGQAVRPFLALNGVTLTRRSVRACMGATACVVPRRPLRRARRSLRGQHVSFRMIISPRNPQSDFMRLNALCQTVHGVTGKLGWGGPLLSGRRRHSSQFMFPIRNATFRQSQAIRRERRRSVDRPSVPALVASWALAACSEGAVVEGEGCRRWEC